MKHLLEKFTRFFKKQPPSLFDCLATAYGYGNIDRKFNAFVAITIISIITVLVIGYHYVLSTAFK